MDHLAENNGGIFVNDRLADICTIRNKGKQFVLVKPTTYMNLSGKAVLYWMNELKIPKENVLVVLDDIAIPFGTLRVRSKGSDGGHNGLRSIHESLGTTEYPRLRFGIGNNYPRGMQAEYVLGKWHKEDEAIVELKIGKAVEVIETFAVAGITTAMNQVNNKEFSID